MLKNLLKNILNSNLTFDTDKGIVGKDKSVEDIDAIIRTLAHESFVAGMKYNGSKEPLKDGFQSWYREKTRNM